MPIAPVCVAEACCVIPSPKHSRPASKMPFHHLLALPPLPCAKHICSRAIRLHVMPMGWHRHSHWCCLLTGCLMALFDTALVLRPAFNAIGFSLPQDMVFSKAECFRFLSFDIEQLTDAYSKNSIQWCINPHQIFNIRLLLLMPAKLMLIAFSKIPNQELGKCNVVIFFWRNNQGKRLFCVIWFHRSSGISTEYDTECIIQLLRIPV